MRGLFEVLRSMLWEFVLKTERLHAQNFDDIEDNDKMNASSPYFVSPALCSSPGAATGSFFHDAKSASRAYLCKAVATLNMEDGIIEAFLNAIGINLAVVDKCMLWIPSQSQPVCSGYISSSGLA
jgi:hypothetical protein